MVSAPQAVYKPHQIDLCVYFRHKYCRLSEHHWNPTRKKFRTSHEVAHNRESRSFGTKLRLAAIYWYFYMGWYHLVLTDVKLSWLWLYWRYTSGKLQVGTLIALPMIAINS